MNWPLRNTTQQIAEKYGKVEELVEYPGSFREPLISLIPVTQGGMLYIGIANFGISGYTFGCLINDLIGLHLYMA